MSLMEIMQGKNPEGGEEVDDDNGFLCLVRDPYHLKAESTEWYQRSKFADVRIRVSDGEILAHRLVLGSMSSFLKSLLRNEEEAVILLPDFSIAEAEPLFERIYGILPHSEVLEPLIVPLAETLRLPRSLSEDLKALIRRPSYDDTDVEDEEEDEGKDLQTLLMKTSTVAVRKANSSIHRCPHCNSSWDDEIKLKYHILIDHRSIVQCAYCNQHYDDLTEFEAHLDEHREPIEIPFIKKPCIKKRKPATKKPSTKKQTSSPKSTVKSLPERPKSPKEFRPTSPGQFKCEHCPDKIFESQTILDYHKLRHSDSNSLSCPHCDRRFNSSKGLAYHLNKHEGVADFLCDDCGSRFITRQKLLNHRRSKHTFERPFVCEWCGDAFSRSDKLVVHKRRAHTGEKPYQCEYCEWRGVDSSALIHHKKKHGPDKITKTIKRYVHMARS